MSYTRVAPIAGAWIEIMIESNTSTNIKVAPLAGAWIEILYPVGCDNSYAVAPLAGAWIEIRKVTANCTKRVSRSPRGSVD